MMGLALILAYSGCATLALAMDRHHRQVWQRQVSGLARLALRLTGSLCLGAAWAVCAVHSGWSTGTVAWFALLSASALGFILLSSYAPRAAAGLALMAIPAVIATVILA
jgi:hypothetical protein